MDQLPTCTATAAKHQAAPQLSPEWLPLRLDPMHLQHLPMIWLSLEQLPLSATGLHCCSSWCVLPLWPAAKANCCCRRKVSAGAAAEEKSVEVQILFFKKMRRIWGKFKHLQFFCTLGCFSKCAEKNPFSIHVAPIHRFSYPQIGTTVGY